MHWYFNCIHVHCKKPSESSLKIYMRVTKRLVLTSCAKIKCLSQKCAVPFDVVITYNNIDGFMQPKQLARSACNWKSNVLQNFKCLQLHSVNSVNSYGIFRENNRVNCQMVSMECTAFMNCLCYAKFMPYVNQEESRTSLQQSRRGTKRMRMDEYLRSRRPLQAPTGVFPPNQPAGLSARLRVTSQVHEANYRAIRLKKTSHRHNAISQASIASRSLHHPLSFVPTKIWSMRLQC